MQGVRPVPLRASPPAHKAPASTLRSFIFAMVIVSICRGSSNVGGLLRGQQAAGRAGKNRRPMCHPQTVEMAVDEMPDDPLMEWLGPLALKLLAQAAGALVSAPIVLLPISPFLA